MTACQTIFVDSKSMTFGFWNAQRSQTRQADTSSLGKRRITGGSTRSGKVLWRVKQDSYLASRFHISNISSVQVRVRAGVGLARTLCAALSYTLFYPAHAFSLVLRFYVLTDFIIRLRHQLLCHSENARVGPVGCLPPPLPQFAPSLIGCASQRLYHSHI